MMTPLERYYLHGFYLTPISVMINTLSPLLDKLWKIRVQLHQQAALDPFHAVLEGKINELTILLGELKQSKTEINDIEFRGSYRGMLQKVNGLLLQGRTFNEQARNHSDSDSMLKIIEDKKNNPHQPPSVILAHESVDLNRYPDNCAPYGTYQGIAPKLGDAHACLQKMVWFILKTGLARLKPSSKYSLEDVFHGLNETASLSTANSIRVKLDAFSSTECYFEYCDLLKYFNDCLNELEIHPQAVMLFMGDIFMDRNGNDLLSALFFKKLHEAGARSIILLSNHDAEFISWLCSANDSDELSYFIATCGQSTTAFKMLTEMNLGSKHEILTHLKDSYFKNLVAFYYEIGPTGKINNIGSHAPNGEWEIFEMVQGLAVYARSPENHRFFTPNQRERLETMNRLSFDFGIGLSHAQLRAMMDLMNEILHVNAIKSDKKDLCDLIGLGTEDFGAEEARGYEISACIAPFYCLIWNRQSPVAAPPKQEPRQFINGHDSADFADHPDEVWFHNNITLDDCAGRGAEYMAGKNLRYMLPVEGFKPMPRVSVTQEKPLRPSQSGKPDMSGWVLQPVTGNKRSNNQL